MWGKAWVETQRRKNFFDKINGLKRPMAVDAVGREPVSVFRFPDLREKQGRPAGSVKPRGISRGNFSSFSGLAANAGSKETGIFPPATG
jgi:hypothetical protein